MSERYYEDFHVGERFRTRGVTVTESEIIDFALHYDPQPFHMDTQAAAASPYGGLIASGFHTLALSFRMFLQEGVMAACSMGSPGIEELLWIVPVRPGDTLRTEAEVVEAHPSSSQLECGVLRMKHSTINQHGETVMTMTVIHLLKRRGVED